MKSRLFLQTLFIILGVSCLCLFAKDKDVPKDMVLTTPSGLKLVLKADNTWTFKDGKHEDFEKDFTVPVNNGKFVLIATDGTWGFVEKELIHQEELVTTDSIEGKGHSVNKDIIVATADAQKQAMTQVVSKMKNALRKLKIDQKLLADCVKRVEKDVDKKEDFKQGAGWDISVRMFLDRGSILAAADCAMLKENDSTAAQKKKQAKK